MREFDNDKHTHTHAQHTDVCACVCECQKDYQKNCWKLSKQATELQKIKLKKKTFCAHVCYTRTGRESEKTIITDDRKEMHIN